jgi:hypothetical protein
VVYEAGPTGFGLARFLTGEGIDCQVAAPSKLQRPSGDRVETDRRDARHLARLLHLGEIVAVAMPRVEQEAARDLVRARDDVRGDLMSARHRLSKLLLRQGIVYYGGKPRTLNHDQWLRAQRRSEVFCLPGLGLAFDIAYDTVGRPCATGPARRRDLPDGRGQRVHPGGDPARLPARGVDVDRVRARGRGRGLVPVDRPLDRRLPRVGAHRIVVRRVAVAGVDHQDRQRARPPAVDRSSLAPPPPLPAGGHPATPPGPGRAARDRGERANRRLHTRWARFDARRKLPVVANTAIARELAGWCWSLAVLDD